MTCVIDNQKCTVTLVLKLVDKTDEVFDHLYLGPLFIIEFCSPHFKAVSCIKDGSEFIDLQAFSPRYRNAYWTVDLLLHPF